MRFKLLFVLSVAALSCGAMTTSSLAAKRHHHRHHHNHHQVRHAHHGRSHFPKVSQATRDHVKAMIAANAPSYGVPKWFALRIAKIESGYNPMVTGAAGEIGVFQLKCSTARGIGFSGSCSALYNPATNIRYGLRYLSMAVRSSHGNLKLAASKHNGGLGRRSLVRSYVSMVF
jgi:soluble lytic murein transglycosylase-like protein